MVKLPVLSRPIQAVPPTQCRFRIPDRQLFLIAPDRTADIECIDLGDGRYGSF